MFTTFVLLLVSLLLTLLVSSSMAAAHLLVPVHRLDLRWQMLIQIEVLRLGGPRPLPRLDGIGAGIAHVSAHEIPSVAVVSLRTDPVEADPNCTQLRFSADCRLRVIHAPSQLGILLPRVVQSCLAAPLRQAFRLPHVPCIRLEHVAMARVLATLPVAVASLRWAPT